MSQPKCIPFVIGMFKPGWPLQNAPPVATSKCPTPGGGHWRIPTVVRGIFSATERV